MGLTDSKELLLRFQRVDGNELYYKKALGEMKTRYLV